MRDDTADICHLRDTLSVFPQVLGDQLIRRLAIALAGKLKLEVAGVELEQMLQQLPIGYVGAMHRIDVPAGTNMYADGLAFLGREAIEDAIVELDEVRKQVAGRPRIARVVARRQAPLGEVHYHARGASGEARADVLLAFIDDIVLELLA